MWKQKADRPPRLFVALDLRSAFRADSAYVAGEVVSAARTRIRTRPTKSSPSRKEGIRSGRWQNREQRDEVAEGDDLKGRAIDLSAFARTSAKAATTSVGKVALDPRKLPRHSGTQRIHAPGVEDGYIGPQRSSEAVAITPREIHAPLMSRCPLTGDSSG